MLTFMFLFLGLDKIEYPKSQNIDYCNLSDFLSIEKQVELEILCSEVNEERIGTQLEMEKLFNE